MSHWFRCFACEPMAHWPVVVVRVRDHIWRETRDHIWRETGVTMTTNMTTEPKYLAAIDDILTRKDIALGLDKQSVPTNGLVIIGPHGCGKDLVANIIQSLTGLEYEGSLSWGSAWTLFNMFIRAGLFNGNEPFCDHIGFYNHRHDYSGYIMYTLDAIRKVNPLFVLSRQAHCKIITGVRTFAEIEVLGKHGNRFLWVHRNVLDDPTLKYNSNDVDGVGELNTVLNLGTKWDLIQNICRTPIVRTFDVKG